MGAFTPILDGVDLGGYQPYRTDTQMLNVQFYADNLGPGIHNLTLISTPSSWVDGGTGTLLIGYANIFTAVTYVSSIFLYFLLKLINAVGLPSGDETVATTGPLQPINTATINPSSSSYGLPGMTAPADNLYNGTDITHK